MLVDEQKTTNPYSNLADELLVLSKEFTSFNTFYACFCDALAELMVEGRVLDGGTVEGVSRCSQWLKYRMQEMVKRLEAVQRRVGHETGTGSRFARDGVDSQT